MPPGARGIGYPRAGYPRAGIRGGCELTWVLGHLLQAHEDSFLKSFFFMDRGDSSVI